MSVGQIDYAEASFPTQRRYAGFWMRFWAYIVDLIIVFSLNGILLSPLKFINEGEPIEAGIWTISGILGTIILYVYFVWMTKWKGQTIGKMIFGLKVIHKEEKPLRWSDLIFREVIGRFFYRVFWIINLLYLVVAFDRKKQGIHDKLADTVVIHED
ncbi:MAG TPA: RDD family protein [Bacillota bacterium]|nr:RDD family protein [Bacillota bacterium]